MRTFPKIYFLAAAMLLPPRIAFAHPIPDIPVRTYFDGDHACRITVEIDIRCFSEDPLNEPYLLNWVLNEMDTSERDQLRASAAKLIQEGVAFRFEPIGTVGPEFDFTFTSKDDQPLSNIDDPVMLTGTWLTSIPEGAKSYQVEALASGKYDLQFLNWLNRRKIERMQVLFPDEKSFLLDLSTVTKTASAPSATPSRYPPFILITAVVAGAIVCLRWARRNRDP